MKTLHICQLTSLHFQESEKGIFLGHFDETLGTDFFFYFLRLCFLKYIPVTLKAPIENSYFMAAIELSLFFNCEQRSVVIIITLYLTRVTRNSYKLIN